MANQHHIEMMPNMSPAAAVAFHVASRRCLSFLRQASLRMRTLHIITGAALIAAFVIGCSKDSSEQLHSVASSSSLTGSQTAKSRLEAIQKDYGVTVDVHNRSITIGTSGLITTNKMSQISDALRDAFGKDFTNYTINYNIH